jgi:N-acetylmuramoyl-L-alanine amidase
MFLLAFAEVQAAAPSLKTYKAKNGTPCVILRNAARYYGLEYRTGKDKTITLQSKWTQLEFTENSRKCLANGLLIWLNEPVTSVRRQPAISASDLHMIIDPLLRPDIHLPDRGHRIILLDPGHGGNDKGAQSPSGTEEKKIVLDIAKRARAKLANAGYRVLLTRSSDRYLTLDARAAKTAQAHADLFVSIHMNSTGNRKAAGIETFVLSLPGHLSTNDSKPGRTQDDSHTGNRSNKANAILAYHVHRNLLAGTKGADRGVKRARFAVLKNAQCPAILVECGFLSNPSEERLFKTAAHRQLVADSLAEGILDYLNAVKRAKVAQ